SSAVIQRMVYLELRGYDFALDGRLNLDCNQLAHTGLYLVNNSEAHVDVRMVQTAVRNARRASTAFTGGEGIALRGAFQNIFLDRPTIENITMAVGAGVAG